MELQGVCIYTGDAPRLASFYEAVLGEAPLREGTYYGFARAQLAVYDPGKVRVVKTKNMSLMFAVTDVQAEYARLLSDAPGIRVASPPQRRPWGAFSCWLLDPDGNQFSLIEKAPEADAGARV